MTDTGTANSDQAVARHVDYGGFGSMGTENQLEVT